MNSLQMHLSCIKWRVSNLFIFGILNSQLPYFLGTFDTAIGSQKVRFLFQKHKGVADPLEVVAGEIADESILLCLDEFMVSIERCKILVLFP